MVSLAGGELSRHSKFLFLDGTFFLLCRFGRHHIHATKLVSRSTLLTWRVRFRVGAGSVFPVHVFTCVSW